MALKTHEWSFCGRQRANSRFTPTGKRRMLLRLAALLCFPAAAARPQPSSVVLASLLRPWPYVFRRSLRIASGVQLNLGLHGAGLSIGRRGLHIGMNRFGEYRKAGIPETSLSMANYKIGLNSAAF